VLTLSEAFSNFGVSEWTYLLRKLSGWKVTVVMLHRNPIGVIYSSYVETNERIYGGGVPPPYRKKLGHHSFDILQKVDTAYRAICESLEGPASCDMFGLSFEALLENPKSLYEFLLIDTNSHFNEFTRRELESILHGRSCRINPTTNVSNNNGKRIVEFLRIVGKMHESRSRTAPFDLYVSDKEVQEIFDSIDFTEQCEIMDNFVEKDYQWSTHFNTSITCSLDIGKCMPRHWALAKELLNMIPCQKNELTIF